MPHDWFDARFIDRWGRTRRSPQPLLPPKASKEGRVGGVGVDPPASPTNKEEWGAGSALVLIFLHIPHKK